MRVVVTGAAGQLGSEVPGASADHDVVALGHGDLDVADGDAVARTDDRHGPDAIVNCAAYNAVDAAETDPDGARLVNVDGPRNLARAAASAGAHLVHLSTDYVFDGRAETPYVETDEPAPATVYGRSKLDGELAVAEHATSWAVVRTAWVFGRVGRSLVETVLARARAGEALRMVDDQRGSPTCALDLAVAVARIATGAHTGVFHVTNGGDCTPHELARDVLELAGLGAADLQAITTAELGRPAPRPRFSVLRSERLHEAGLAPLRHYREALRALIPELTTLEGGR